VVLRVDRAFQAFFQRMREGQTPGYPRFHGRDRYNSFTYPQVGDHGGARLDNGFLVLSKIGRITLCWSRPLVGTPKTVTISREADGWYVCFSCTDVPIQPLPPTGQETGIDLGIEAFATLSDGTRIFNPGWYRAAACLWPQARQSPQAQGGGAPGQGTSTRAASAAEFPPQDRAHPSCVSRTRSITRTCSPPTW
jgi:putative transposase